MKKILLSVIFIVGASSIANAEVYVRNATITSVNPIYETVFIEEPAMHCEDIKNPIYSTRQKEGNAAGGALLGMIIGGAVGKGLTGKNDGAAVGAVMGGLIGADQGSKPKTENFIIGYETKRHCYNTLVSKEVNRITSYNVTYKWRGLIGSFYSTNKLSVGDSIKININLTTSK